MICLFVQFILISILDLIKTCYIVSACSFRYFRRMNVENTFFFPFGMWMVIKFDWIALDCLLRFCSGAQQILFVYYYLNKINLRISIPWILLSFSNTILFALFYTCRSRNSKPTRGRVSMMPIGTPRVPYRNSAEGTWQWVDLWNALVSHVGFFTAKVEKLLIIGLQYRNLMG